MWSSSFHKDLFLLALSHGNENTPPWVIGFFFYIGMVSATLFRLIIFLNRVNLFYARLAWYVGVFGYILFFGFRYYIAKKRLNIF